MQKNSEQQVMEEKSSLRRPASPGRFFNHVFTGFLVTWLPCVFLFSILIKGIYIIIAGTAAALLVALVYAKVVNR